MAQKYCCKACDYVYNPQKGDREGGMMPVVTIDKPLSNRMASTIRHNRARGAHSIELICNIVAELTKSGMSDSSVRKLQFEGA